MRALLSTAVEEAVLANASFLINIIIIIVPLNNKPKQSLTIVVADVKQRIHGPACHVGFQPAHTLLHVLLRGCKQATCRHNVTTPCLSLHALLSVCVYTCMRTHVCIRPQQLLDIAPVELDAVAAGADASQTAVPAATRPTNLS